MKKTLLFVLVQLCIMTSLQAEGKVFSIADFGLKPNTRENAVPFVQQAIEACSKEPGSTLHFPKGRYDFWAAHAVEREYFETNTYDVNPKILAVTLDRISNLTIDGDGSEFIMHGRMQPVTLDHCKNITLKNFTVDWDIPLTAQGTVVSDSKKYMDVEIDTHQYPYIIENNKLVFVGEGWKSELWGIMQFEPDTHFVLPNSGDNLGWRSFSAKEIKKGLVRLSNSDGKENKNYPPAKTILVLRHNSRDHAGIFIYHSEDTKLKNVKLFHTGGLGILSQYSKNIDFDDVHVIPNKAKNRVLSGHDDGFHFMGCSGLLKIENCSWAGLMDDPINIHGTCARIVEILSPTRVKCRFMHDMSEGMEWGRVGEAVGFIENNSMRTEGKGKIASYEMLTKSDFVVELSEAMLKTVEVGHALENLSCTADAEVRNCHFGSCRARGMLITTPGKVIVEDNVFESSGSAILIAGDANQWYESGAVKDVVIRRNEFRYPCNSSSYQFCEAVISIFPEIPSPDIKYPFHQNIRIEDNTFHLFDYPILYAKSVDGLTFERNTLIRNTTYEPTHRRKYGISLESCVNVRISDNKVEGDVLGNTIKIDDKMKKSNVKLTKNKFFKFAK